MSRGVPDRRPGDRLLQRSYVGGGVAVAAVPLADSREHLREALISIPWEGLRLTAGDPAIPVTMIPANESSTP